MARKRYLIVGDGAAGRTAAASLRHADAEAVIGMCSDEPVPGYYRAALTNYLLGELREDQLRALGVGNLAEKLEISEMARVEQAIP